MKDEIENKIRKLLAGHIREESQVTYLLVECRKLLEHDETLETKLPTLQFYCNWGLHVRLTRSAAQAFLAAVDPVLTLNGAMSQRQHEMLNALLTFDTFRSELRLLLQQIGADLAICNDYGSWISFVHLYSHVVGDSELVLEKTSPAAGPMGLAVKKLTIVPISRVALTEEVVAVVYPMIWKVEYEDGRIARLDLGNLGLAGATLRLFGPTPESASFVDRMKSRAE